jgi:hypothetical protein
MAKIFEKLIFGGLHEKNAVQGGIWVPTQHLVLVPRKTTKTRDRGGRSQDLPDAN